MKNKNILFIIGMVFLSIILINAGGFATDRKVTGYFYDPNVGKILPKFEGLDNPLEVKDYLEGLEDGFTVTVKGNLTYYRDEEGKLVKLVRRVKDANGNISRIDKYFYDENGKVKYLDRRYYNHNGTTSRHYTVSYDENGKVKYVLDERYDSDGNLTKIYEYLNYSYFADGIRKGFTRRDYDAGGNLLRQISLGFNTEGKRISYHSIRYDLTTGRKTSELTLKYNDEGIRVSFKYQTYDPSTGNKRRDYTRNYDSTGKTSSVIDKRYDSDGNLTRTYEYTGFSYNEKGQLAGYTRTDKDSNGNFIVQYEYTDYIYDSDGKRIQFTRYTKDAEGNITRICIWRSTSGWNCT
jgi:hypothetical protein